VATALGYAKVVLYNPSLSANLLFNNLANMKNIKKVHVGEDYTTYSFEYENDELVEVEITGIAQEIINTLGKALLKKSFK
jgi:hypothetical protein